MKKVTIYILLIIIILPEYSQGQRWKRTRYELIGGIGLSNLMGDLGGANSNAIYMIDYDLLATRFALDVGMRYKIKERFAVKLNLIAGMLNGSDYLTKASGRYNRYLKANTFIFENSLQAEYSLIGEKLSTRYTFRNMRDFR
ncbi:MAG: hypothetical protein KJ607_07155, partial [Bacteroidetes bacterium]|nr:hypothetical protein [Bacteroidota bacterium]